MKGRMLVLVTLLVLLALASECWGSFPPKPEAPILGVSEACPGCPAETPHGQRASFPRITEAHRTAFSDTRTIRLVVCEEAVEEGGRSGVAARGALADVLASAGLEVVESEEADAKLVVRAPARGSSRGAAEAILTMRGCRGLRAAWWETWPPETPGGAEASSASVSPGPALTEECSVRSFLCLLVELDTETFCSLLQADEERERESALAVAVKWGEAPVVPALTEMLRDPDRNWRRGAARALGSCGFLAKDAAASLVDALEDEHSCVRVAVAQALGAIEAEPEAVTPALIKALGDEDACVRTAAARALGGVGAEPEAVTPALINALADEDARVRMAAARALGRFWIGLFGTTAQEAVPALAEALGDSSLPVRLHVAQTLGRIGFRASPAASALARALRDEDATMRATAAHALSQMGIGAGPAVPALIEALEDEDPRVRCNAAAALAPGSSLPLSESGVKALIDALRDSDPRVRRKAVAALGEIGRWERRWAAGGLGEPDRVAEHAGAALTELLSDADWHARVDAAVALIEMGCSSEAAVQSILQALKHEKLEVRRHAAMTLAGSRPPAETVPGLIEALSDADGGVRAQAALALARTGPAAEAAASALVAALRDEDAAVRRQAAYALRTLDTEGDLAVSALVDALRDERPRVRESAAYSLGGMDSLPGPARRALAEALKDGDAQVRLEAAVALFHTGSAQEGLLMPVIEVLRDEHRRVRIAAAQALARIGPAARAAIPALEKLAVEERHDRALRWEARKALERIRGDE